MKAAKAIVDPVKQVCDSLEEFDHLLQMAEEEGEDEVLEYLDQLSGELKQKLNSLDFHVML